MYSQLGADAWILEQHPSPGYWLEIGCADGSHLSNTRLLEEHGWTGLSVDPLPTNWDNRKVRPVKEVVWDKSEDVVFTVSGELSGIKDTLNLYKDALKCAPVVTLTSITPELLLQKYHVPKLIDFMSLDTEGSEYDILSVFPFNEYTVQYICVEHNNEQPKLDNIVQLLDKEGYIVDRFVKWDVWFRRV